MPVRFFTTAGRILTFVTSYHTALACRFAVAVRMGLSAKETLQSAIPLETLLESEVFIVRVAAVVSSVLHFTV